MVWSAPWVAQKTQPRKRGLQSTPVIRMPPATVVPDMKPILATCVSFILLDAIWLTGTAGLYRQLLPPILAARPNLIAAVIFYALYLVGLIFFALRPWLTLPWPQMAVRGALFGLITYATYDLTNQATVAGWPWRVTVMDLAWGAALSAAACVAGRLAAGA